MRTIILGVLVAVSLAAAQNTLWVDLSGEWRMSTDSRPEFAAPDFDDHSWAAVKLPWNRPRSGLWLRRTVSLPYWADRTQLALTLGTINDAYEVYANGVRIGDTGGLSPWDYRIPRPLTFRIPATALDTGNQSGNRLVIAIRSLRFDGFSLRSRWQLQPAGPFLVTDARYAPVDAGERHLRDRRYDLGFQAIIAILSLVLAAVVLLAWSAERKRTETLWLALFLAALGTSELLVIGLIREDFQPLQWNLPSKLGSFLVTLGFAGFAATAMGLAQRWHPAAKWLTGATLLLSSVAVSAIQFNSPFVPYNAWVSGATVLAVLLGWWLNGGIRQTISAQLFAATLLFAAGLRFNAFFGFAGMSLDWFSGLGIGNNSLMFFVASIPMVIQMLLSVAADRREGQRLAAEMEAGRGVQQLLLASAALPPSGGYRVEAVYEPAQELGGDFHWSRTQPDGCLLVAVGDVSGKGLKAAMLVSVTVGILRNEKSDSPGAILAAMNEGLAGHTGGGFVTCCCARFGPDGAVTIANAGHLSPYRDGLEVEVEAGLPLGIAGGVEYRESTVCGGSFTLMSDGVVEAENARRELFGFARTREISTKSAREIADAAKAWGQNDDITVVTVRRTS